MTDLSSKIDCYDVLTLMLSSLCHDLDHPGYNNTYQVPRTTTFAMALHTVFQKKQFFSFFLSFFHNLLK